VWGEVAAPEAGCYFPLVETSRAYATSVEGVPREAAVAEPAVFRVRRPVALGTADAGTARAAVRSLLDAYAATRLDLVFHGVMHPHHPNLTPFGNAVGILIDLDFVRNPRESHKRVRTVVSRIERAEVVQNFLMEMI
jgi:hypothetical protein